MIRRLIRPRWQIGILRNPLEDVVNGAVLEYDWLKSPYRDGWMADPFVLSVSEKEIELLVEDFRYKDRKGRISKVKINRETKKIIDRQVLLEGGHYSFPAILRKDGKIYVYPEQSMQRTLELFEYDLSKERLRLVKTLCKNPLSDAVMYDGWLFSIIGQKAGDHILAAWPLAIDLDDEMQGIRQEDSPKTYFFEEEIARNAGGFFKCEDKVYRPAQECNLWYGNALSIQRFEEGKFTEVRRIPGLHTLNSYQGVTVVDRKIFPFKWLFWLLRRSDK